jgi:hypothetical protein
VNSHSFSDFLARSLELLALDAPASYAAVASKLGSMRVNIEVDGERLGVQAHAGRLVVGVPSHSAAAEAGATRRALVRLLSGDLGLTEAILADEVRLQGALEHLVAFYEALLGYFRGAVASPAFPGLLDAFMDSSRSDTGRGLSAVTPVEAEKRHVECQQTLGQVPQHP